jgi:hypothetical protein
VSNNKNNNKVAQWDGPDPPNRTLCPYSVDFVCKPAPAESLNSLESGKLLLTITLGNNSNTNPYIGVKSVAIKITNNAKKENLDKIQGDSQLKYQTSLSVNLLQDNKKINGPEENKWIGEMSIPSNWTEGGTRTYEKTGSAAPKSNKNLFTLEITYHLDNGNNCTACFNSEDAFHWQAR